MQIAQGLYEGVNIGSQRLGLITYMRTDSTRIAESALRRCGISSPRSTRGSCRKPPTCTPQGKGAQDAHEAIRPTYVTRTPAGAEEAPHLGGVPPLLDHLGALRLLPDEPFEGEHHHRGFRRGQRLFRASSTRVVEKGFQKALAFSPPRNRPRRCPPFEPGRWWSG